MRQGLRAPGPAPRARRFRLQAALCSALAAWPGGRARMLAAAAPPPARIRTPEPSTPACPTHAHTPSLPHLIQPKKTPNSPLPGPPCRQVLDVSRCPNLGGDALDVPPRAVLEVLRASGCNALRRRARCARLLPAHWLLQTREPWSVAISTPCGGRPRLPAGCLAALRLRRPRAPLARLQRGHPAAARGAAQGAAAGQLSPAA